MTEALLTADERERFDLGAAEVDADPDGRRAPWMEGERYARPRRCGTARGARTRGRAWR
jgi:hypothetical protein